jgi:hypothetical protein
MTESTVVQAFEARCAVFAAYASARGLALRKSREKHELEVLRSGKKVAFPIVSDPHFWELMSPEAAFYGAMVDAKSWRNVRLDDAMPLIVREANAESQRMSKLAAMLDGQANLDALLEQVAEPA